MNAINYGRSSIIELRRNVGNEGAKPVKSGAGSDHSGPVTGSDKKAVAPTNSCPATTTVIGREPDMK